MSDFPVKVGVIGCGDICEIYLRNARRFPEIQVVACSDLLPQRAQAKAAEFRIRHAPTTAELLADPAIEIVLNLTVPRAHAEVTLAALGAGKSVYTEKPLATSRAAGQRILDLARQRGLRVGGAPDTFLGAGLQTARQLIDSGALGLPVAATAFMTCHGHENWHPSPEFHYQPGGGPLLDMGPYYLTALVSLLGPVRRVCASARISFPERCITSSPKRGQSIRVETPTHVAGVLDFASGPVATLITSFDIWHANLPFLEIYGSAASLSLGDPNGFGGPLRLRRADDPDWNDVPLEFPYADNSRGLGLADMAHALRTGRSHRAGADLIYHVLDVMQAMLDSSERAAHVELTSTCARPAPFPARSKPGVMDD